MVSSSNHVLPSYHSIPFTKKTTKKALTRRWTSFWTSILLLGWIYMMKFRKESSLPRTSPYPTLGKRKNHRHKSALGGAPTLVPSKNPNNTHHPRIQTTAIELQHLSHIQTTTLPGFGGWFFDHYFRVAVMKTQRIHPSMARKSGNNSLHPSHPVAVGSSTGFNKQRLQTSRRLENVKLGQKKGGSVVYECSRF